jgi:hypothetical protein
MREYITKTIRVGDSIIVILPKELVSAEQITENIYVKIAATKCRRDESVEPRGSASSYDDDPWRLLE